VTWFKVDDGFPSHPKVLAIPKAKRARVLGVWLMCGTWSARHLTDGFIPATVLAELGGTRADAQLLVDAKSHPGGPGLWTAVDGGWQFHDWSPIQPTRAEIEELKRVRAEAGAKGGKASGKARGGLRAVGDM
jgi:hypothetical protein